MAPRDSFRHDDPLCGVPSLQEGKHVNRVPLGVGKSGLGYQRSRLHEFSLSSPLHYCHDLIHKPKMDVAKFLEAPIRSNPRRES